MKRWASYAVVVLMLAGCGTAVKRPDTMSGPVVPGPDELVTVDQAIVLVDCSSSMRTDKIRTERILVESLYELMPDGDYSTGMIAFGDDGKKVYRMESPFHREVWAARASKTPFIGGNTPLELSLEKTYAMLSGASGKTAVIIFSDGKPTIPDAAMETARKLADHPSGEVCIHTIHIGDNMDGQAFLEGLSTLTSCGSYQKGDTLLDGAALRQFVRDVFIGKKPVVVKPKPKPERKPKPEPKDTDQDGVIDEKDQCPGTPKGAKVDERGCWVIPGVTFELDKAIIRPVFYSLLDDVVLVLKQNPDLRIYLDGHTCDRGTDKHNQGLSKQRAKAVQNYLIDKGVDESRLVPRGFGETKPAYPNTNETNRSKNRRVELTVITK